VQSKILLAFLAAASCIYELIPMASADMSMTVSQRERLELLLERERINNEQFYHIVDVLVSDDILDETAEYDMTIKRTPLSNDRADIFRDWLVEHEQRDLELNTANLLRNMFALGAPQGRDAPDVPKVLAPADYTGNGVVKLLARSDFSRNICYNQIYNGIWGYKTGKREYALQCDHIGLNILDVTTNNIVVIQTIEMTGGDVYRDVATHENYAYVAAQKGRDANAWVVDLSQLSSDSAQLANSNPISINKIKDLGYTDWGHTLNVWNGLLFLNDSFMGCKILDLRNNPMKPVELINYEKGECHDSYVHTINDKDILFASDGQSGSWNLLDITNIREPNFKFKSIAETDTEYNAYAHSSVVSEDGKTLFAFEESNKFDIAAFDISNPKKPRLIMKFQWSGDIASPALAHNGFVRGKYLHVAYYAAGYRVFDIADVSNGNIKEVGKYETFRDPDGDGILDNLEKFEGGWNVFVGLPNKILVSDTKHGTFVMEIDDSTSKCPSGKALFRIVVNTDSNGDKITVVVKSKQKGKWKRQKGLYQKGLPSNDETVLEKCLKKKSCYKFLIKDEVKGGLCCEDGEGNYKLDWDGQEIQKSKFKDKKKELTKFGCGS